jgi:hypothetical protein
LIRRTVLSLVVAVCVSLAACSDDDSEPAPTEPAATSQPPTSTSTPTSAVESDQAAAESALLLLGDFPAGWTEVPADADEDVSRQVAACAGVDATSSIDVGGALSRTGTFTSPAGDAVAETVTVAASTATATARVAAIADPGFASCARDVYQQWAQDNVPRDNIDVGEVTIPPLKLSKAGDDTVAYRVTIPIASNGSSLGEVYADLVVVRVGRALAGMFFQRELTPFPIDDTQHYVALAAERLSRVS